MSFDELIKASRAEQGGDKFPGIDEPYRKTLPQGTILIKFEPSKSGFFVSEQPVNQLEGNSKDLMQAFQVAPWENKNKSVNPSEYLYRENASVFVTNREMDVAASLTDANPQYGQGGPEQVHIAGYKKDDMAKNLSLGLKKVGDIKLTDFNLDRHSGEKLEALNNLHVQTRNYFCYLSQAQDLNQILPQLRIPQQINTCQAKIAEIDKEISLLRKDLLESHQGINAKYPAFKNISFPTYQDKVNQLEKLAARPEKGLNLINSAPQNEATELRRHLLGKVQDSISNVVSGKWPLEKCDQEIKIDDLRQAYEADQFMLRAQCQQQISANTDRVRQLEQRIGLIDNREQQLYRLGKLMHTLQEQRPLAEQAEQRMFFKKSFHEKHLTELRAYKNSQSELGENGIHSPKDLKNQQDQFQLHELPSREALHAELTSVNAHGQELRAEMRSLNHHQSEYTQFRTMKADAQNLTGPKLSMS